MIRAYLPAAGQDMLDPFVIFSLPFYQADSSEMLLIKAVSGGSTLTKWHRL
jgi:hypothetical protein